MEGLIFGILRYYETMDIAVLKTTIFGLHPSNDLE